MIHIPDNWIVVKIKSRGENLFSYRLLISWKSERIGPENWRLTGNIVKCEKDLDDEQFWCFYGASGNVYRCSKFTYENHFQYLKWSHIFNDFEENLGEKYFDFLPAETNWLDMNWN